jgi:hypothetical protein
MSIFEKNNKQFKLNFFYSLYIDSFYRISYKSIIFISLLSTLVFSGSSVLEKKQISLEYSALGSGIVFVNLMINSFLYNIYSFRYSLEIIKKGYLKEIVKHLNIKIYGHKALLHDLLFHTNINYHEREELVLLWEQIPQLERSYLIDKLKNQYLTSI